MGVVRDEGAQIFCNEGGAVVRTVRASELLRTLDEMESKLDLAITRCRHCGAVNLQPGFDRLIAFVCDRCGKSNKVVP